MGGKPAAAPLLPDSVIQPESGSLNPALMYRASQKAVRLVKPKLKIKLLLHQGKRNLELFHSHIVLISFIEFNFHLGNVIRNKLG